MSEKIFYQNWQDCAKQIANSQHREIEIINKPNILSYMGINLGIRLANFFENETLMIKPTAAIGDSSFDAINAMKSGYEKIVFSGDEEILKKLCDIANKISGKIEVVSK